ncbi:LytTR family DNA-binding domain-containing protein [Reichenbachiella carrageenanivorans]|uniref:LytTR family DNA-binding domain-containing protein n=1 Tax=Reichenbachiella carrageenanivorans TaxID=2979869 RepID=A0ABY6CWI3_9BACT|nr:LytTR family DNA-binding domain-containing protein [Reichenbachiella carrageenanivorans]UXX78281.1 LytTR family DNA-binding domain-containing protein [Reichenbachiella carrageenanivorans]
MSTYKVIIIDDEPPARNVIKHFLQSHEDFELVGEAENGFDGLKLIQSLQPDLIFLDIQMPKLTGFELLELIDEPPVIIFSTAYDQYALKAFELHAADYLLKPFNRKRFDDGLAKALSLMSSPKPAMPTESLVQEYLQTPTHRVVVKDGSKINIIPADDIIRIAAQDDYSELITAKGKHLKKQTMKHLEQVLDPKKFARVHRSSIVQVSQIAKIDKYGKETHLAQLKNGDEVVVSASGYSKLKELLGW